MHARLQRKRPPVIGYLHLHRRHIRLAQPAHTVQPGGRVAVQRLYDQIAQRLILPLSVRRTRKRELRQFLRLFNAVFPQQLPDPGQAFPGVLIYPVAEAAVPDRVFVEVDPFNGGAAEHHRAHAAVTQRKRFLPAGRGAGKRKLRHYRQTSTLSSMFHSSPCTPSTRTSLNVTCRALRRKKPAPRISGQPSIIAG